MANLNALVFQLKVSLLGIEPPVWRRIQVPAKYSFWDLHVAIQDSMGWLDYHLHAFRIRRKHKSRPSEIGIPDDFSDNVEPGWEVSLTDIFFEPGQIAAYEYDFGDGWEHEVLLEGILLKDKALAYPRCIDGARACPPEDCGGIPGYEELLEILGNPKHSEFQGMNNWLKGHAKNYYPYDPDRFDPTEVRFDNPKKRWKEAFR